MFPDLGGVLDTWPLRKASSFCFSVFSWISNPAEDSSGPGTNGPPRPMLVRHLHHLEYGTNSRQVASRFFIGVLGFSALLFEVNMKISQNFIAVDVIFFYFIVGCSTISAQNSSTTSQLNCEDATTRTGFISPTTTGELPVLAQQKPVLMEVGQVQKFSQLVWNFHNTEYTRSYGSTYICSSFDDDRHRKDFINTWNFV